MEKKVRIVNPKKEKDKSQEPNKIEKALKIKRKTRMRTILVYIVAVIAFLILYINLRASYLEIKEIGEGYTGVFFTNLFNTALVGISNFIFVFLLIYFSTKKIKAGLKTFFDAEKKEEKRIPQKSISFIIATISSIITTPLIIEKAILCFSGSQFVELDPVFGIDLGFFVFTLPFIDLIAKYILISVIISFVYEIVYYIIALNVSFDGIDREVFKKSKILNQGIAKLKVILVLIAIVLLIVAGNYGVQKFINLPVTSEGEYYSLYGAGKSELTIKLVGMVLLAVMILISGFKALGYATKKGSNKKVVWSILIVPIYVIIFIAVDVLFNVFYINTNELEKENIYIKNNIKATMVAYGLDKAEEINLIDGGTISKSQLLNEVDTINNIPIANDEAVLKTLKVNQTYKNYYTYPSTSVGLYNIDGRDDLVYISPREIAMTSGSYSDKTYSFTHGYSVIVSSATDLEEDGSILNLQKSFEETQNKIKIIEPRIYFGLNTNSTVVTNGNTVKEFDYPTSDKLQDMTYTYTGEAGTSAGILDRIVLAFKEKDFNLLSGNITDDSRIITNRNIIERAKTILPYITYDENPYMVVSDNGELIWVLDGYTTSDVYPYSQKVRISTNGLFGNKEINYIRNSVKVLVNAFTGEMKFYITDKTDPIIMAYNKTYDGLFTKEEIPQDVARHFKYPKYLYDIQMKILRRYHNDAADELYREADVWSVAKHNKNIVASKTGVEMESYYTMLKPSDSSNSVFGLVLPFTNLGNQGIKAFAVGTVQNGQNVLKYYKYNDDVNILGPMQLDAELEQDEKIYSEIQSLNVTGTKVTKDMIIVPINNTFLYVVPIYQEYVNEKDSIPLIKKIVVASGTKLAIGDTFKEALSELVSINAIDIEIQDKDNLDYLVNEIIKANNNLKMSTESNDWEQIGKDQATLQNLINRLEEYRNKQKTEETKSADVENSAEQLANSILR